MTTLTCYSRPPLSRIEERALLNTPANLSFKFDDTLHARGARSLDSCQDTKENPGQMIMILQTLSVKQSTQRMILYLPISITFFSLQIPSIRGETCCVQHFTTWIIFSYSSANIAFFLLLLLLLLL